MGHFRGLRKVVRTSHSPQRRLADAQEQADIGDAQKLQGLDHQLAFTWPVVGPGLRSGRDGVIGRRGRPYRSVIHVRTRRFFVAPRVTLIEGRASRTRTAGFDSASSAHSTILRNRRAC
jgi:hypothetical protein